MSSVTVSQLRMARAALNWTLSDLSEASSVSSRTIRRIESENGLERATSANLKLIRETLEAAGIEFIGTAEEGPGVRLWSKSASS